MDVAALAQRRRQHVCGVNCAPHLRASLHELLEADVERTSIPWLPRPPPASELSSEIAQNEQQFGTRLGWRLEVAALPGGQALVRLDFVPAAPGGVHAVDLVDEAIKPVE
ncbi:MAG: hypothetical protein HY329_24655 [Chloroflexi bacterium]|nr:hypothetical protein [Chloroflexota bacterium]